MLILSLPTFTLVAINILFIASIIHSGICRLLTFSIMRVLSTLSYAFFRSTNVRKDLFLAVLWYSHLSLVSFLATYLLYQSKQPFNLYCCALTWHKSLLSHMDQLVLIHVLLNWVNMTTSRSLATTGIVAMNLV